MTLGRGPTTTRLATTRAAVRCAAAVCAGAVLCVATIHAATCSAVGAAQPADPFEAVRTRDPVELARAVARAGDDAVLERLGEATARPARLAAVYASPHMRGPEAALGALAAMASGRDPELAPAAAFAAAQIARGLDAGALARREAPAEELASARVAFAALAADETARPDLRAAAYVVLAHLIEAGAAEAGAAEAGAAAR